VLLYSSNTYANKVNLHYYKNKNKKNMLNISKTKKQKKKSIASISRFVDPFFSFYITPMLMHQYNLEANNNSNYSYIAHVLVILCSHSYIVYGIVRSLLKYIGICSLFRYIFNYTGIIIIRTLFIHYIVLMLLVVL